MASSEPPSTPSAQASSSTPIASPSTPSAADDAKAKREARKARILGKGSDRLNKLTKQARGEEAEMLYPSSDNTPSHNRTASNSTSTRAAAAVSPTGEEDPDDFDISNQGRMDGELQQAMQRFQEQQQQSQQTSQQQPQDPMQQMMAALMGGGGPGGQGGGMPDLSQLFAAMNGSTGQNGEPQLGPDGQPLPPIDNPFAAFANMAGGGGGGGLFGPQGKVEATGKTLLDRLFSITHIVLFCLLGFFAISSSLSGGSSVGSSVDSSFVDKSASADEVVSAGRDSLLKWASLAYHRPGLEDAHHFRLDGSWLGLGSSVPIFYLFLLLETLLQSSRILLFSSKPPPSSLMFSLASQIPIPTVQWVLKVGARYMSILSSFLDDLAILVFVVGAGVAWSVVRSGSV